MPSRRFSDPAAASALEPAKTRRGLLHMLAACLCFSVMTACVFAVKQCEPQLPAALVSFVRVLINLSILAVPALSTGRFMVLFGDFRGSLWLRGIFGGVSLMLSFASIQLVGPGESAFLGASSGIFVVVLSPWILGQRNSAAAWLAVCGAFGGLTLLFEPDADHGDFLGRVLGLGSGFLAALAYLMVARAGRSNSPETVIFYFCLVAGLLHLVYFLRFGWVWPRTADAWVLMGIGGVSASLAQSFMTRAYQMAPASLVSAVAYASPVLSLGWAVLLFQRVPDPRALLGCVLVLLCGVLLPFLTASSPARPHSASRSAGKR